LRKEAKGQYMATSFAKIIIRDLDKTVKEINAEEARTKKAAETAVKVEGYRLMKLLKEEIKAGAPGGREFSPLTEIAKRTGSSQNRKPLSRLAIPVRYKTTRNNNRFEFNLGFIAEKTSKSWMKIAGLQTEGGSIPVDDETRRYIKLWGIVLKIKKDKKSKEMAKYFFLLPSTVRFRIPARPIMEPFESKYASGILSNIKSNFERKMKGETI
jgi:hypothetical protein